MKPTSFTRRQFICKSGKAGMALATVWSTPALTAGSAPVSLPENASPRGEAAGLRDLFLNPPHSARDRRVDAEGFNRTVPLPTGLKTSHIRKAIEYI